MTKYYSTTQRINNTWKNVATTLNTELTHKQRSFILVFLTEIISGLQEINNESVEYDEEFARECDLLCVIEEYTALVKTATNIHESSDLRNACASCYNFSLAQAQNAILSYDTEYREQIAEQFEESCEDDNKALANLILNF